MPPIYSFTGPHFFLSNFYPAVVMYEGMKFPSVEHAYQAAKCSDPLFRKDIQVALTARDAKKYGRYVRLRSDWEQVKLVVMKDLIEQKFMHGTEMSRRLLKTGEEELIEGNWWGDRYWGKCGGIGENHLGRLLMEQRRELQNVGTK